MATNYNPATVSNGLVLCVDAANTKSYPGSGTAMTDMSGKGNHGTLTNGPTFSSDNNGSIVLDGSNDYISTINLSSFTTFTIQMWIFDSRSASGGLDILTYNGDSGSYTFSGNTFRTDGNNLTARTTTIGGYHPLGKWFQFTYTKNGSLFLDNKEYSSFTGSELGTYGVLDIGRSRSHVNSLLNGKISNVKVYDRALTASEVRQNYNANKGRFGL